MQKTEFEDWQRIAEVVNQLDLDVIALVRELNSVPKSEWGDAHRKANEGMSELKHLLEERVAKEHPDKWDTDMFYGQQYMEPSWE